MPFNLSSITRKILILDCIMTRINTACYIHNVHLETKFQT